MNDNLEIAEYFRIIYAKRVWVVGLASAVLLIFFAFTAFSAPVYQASTRLLVTVSSDPATGPGASAESGYQNLLTSEKLARTYSEIATSRTLLERVAKSDKIKSSADVLSEQVKAGPVRDTQMLEIVVSSESADQAALTANTAGQQLIDEVSKMISDARGSARDVSIRTVESAVAPGAPANSVKIDGFIMVFLAGLGVSSLLVLIVNRLDRRVRRGEQLARIVPGVPLLASVEISSAGPAEWERAIGSMAQNFRYLNHDDQFKVVAVTSAASGEGKTSASLAIGKVLAKTGLKVLLIEADMRQSELATRHGWNPALGLAEVLIGAATIESSVLVPEDSGLHVLVAGSLPPNALDLFASSAMERMLQQASEKYDVVLLDAPPTGALSPALASLICGMIVVVRSGKPSEEALTELVVSLKRSGIKTAGLVINGFGSLPTTTQGSQASQAKQPAGELVTVPPERSQ